MAILTPRESMVYTSNKREGQPGFSFPEGCPEGRKRAQRVGPRDIPRGKKTQAVPTSCWRYVILLQVVLSLFHTPPVQPGKYDSVFFILSRLDRGSMKNTLSYFPGWTGGVWKTGLTGLSVDILISTLLIINKGSMMKIRQD